MINAGTNSEQGNSSLTENEITQNDDNSQVGNYASVVSQAQEMYNTSCDGTTTMPRFQKLFHGGSYEADPFNPVVTSGNSTFSNLRGDFSSGITKSNSMFMPHMMDNFGVKMDGAFNMSSTGNGNSMTGQWNDPSFHVHGQNVANNNVNNKNVGNRGRTTYTEQQVVDLEEAFKSNPYPTAQTRNVLAQKVGVPEGKVKIWFQNRRARAKKLKTSMILPWKHAHMMTSKHEEPNMNNNNISPLHSQVRPQSIGSLLPLPTMSGSIPPKKLPLTLDKPPYHHEPSSIISQHCFRNSRDEPGHWFRGNYNITRPQFYHNTVNYNKQSSFRLPTVWPMSSANNQTKMFHTAPFPSGGDCMTHQPITSYDHHGHPHQVQDDHNRHYQTKSSDGQSVKSTESPSTSSRNSICSTVATLDINCADNDTDKIGKEMNEKSPESSKDVCLNYTLKTTIHEAYRHANSMLSPPPIRRFVFPFNTMMGDQPQTNFMQGNAPTATGYEFTMQGRSAPPEMDSGQFWKPPGDGNYKYSNPNSYNLPQSGAMQPYFGMAPLNLQTQGSCLPRFNQEYEMGGMSSYTGYPLSKQSNADQNKQGIYGDSTISSQCYNDSQLPEEISQNFVDRRNSDDSTESSNEVQTIEPISIRPHSSVWTVNNLIKDEPPVSDWEGEKSNFSVPKEFAAVRT